MKIVCVAGARPNFVKIAPILRALAAKASDGIEAILVDTGQHYDDSMAGSFLHDLRIPPPHHCLRAGSGSHASQTAVIMQRFEPVLLEERPQWVVVVGDVNSTLACALVAAKLGVPIAHVEAGLRSFDRTMPEEINRVVTDALADLLFTTERSANENLTREGVSPEKVFFVGNVMVDSLRWAEPMVRRSTILQRLGIAPESYALVTLHRPANVDDPRQLAGLLDALAEVNRELPVLLPVHPRTRSRIDELQLRNIGRTCGDGAPVRDRVALLEPQAYVDFLQLLSKARIVLTDSGGVQEETTCLGVPCLSLRTNTERPVTIELGSNTLAGSNPAHILEVARAALHAGGKTAGLPPLWDGHAAERIVSVLMERR